ncbi:hypothetical protein GCM10011538_14240 [Ligilactobacillus murinus]
MGDLLANKTILVMGVANRRSIAWGCAQIMQEQGANLIYTYQNERLKKGLLKLVGDEASLFECDVADDNSIAQAFNEIKHDMVSSMGSFMRSLMHLKQNLKVRSQMRLVQVFKLHLMCLLIL